MRARTWARARGGIAAALALSFTLQIIGPPDAAEAKGPFVRGLYDDDYYSANPQVRSRLFDAAAAAGAGMVQVRISWRDATGPVPPANPRNPGDPRYRFEVFDAAIRSAAERGLGVFVTVSLAPSWAEGSGRPASAAPGTWKPDPGAFGAFGEAVARRYSGSFAADPAAGPLPAVQHFEAWNEPNVEQFLAPQWQRGKPFAPAHFRKMLNAFYRGIGQAGTGAQVIGPGTAPYGDPGRTGERMRPLLFIRELFCLRGRQLDATACPQPAMLDIVSHHPMNLVGGPKAPPQNRDDLVVANMSRLREAVRAAERQGTLRPRGHRPLWVSELWWLTDPPSDNGFSPQLQAHFVEQALYLLWKQGVQAVFWFEITDASGFPSGLYFANGQPKPSLTAFRFPFVVDRTGAQTTAWSIPPEGGTLTIQRRIGGRWRAIRSLQVVAGKPVQARLSVPAGAKLRASVGSSASLVWNP